MVQHPDVHAVSFTGSNEVGGLIYAAGARKMKKCQCEMGGKNPIVSARGRRSETRRRIGTTGAFGSSGQRCTATSRVVVEDEVADKFVAMLVERAARISQPATASIENVSSAPWWMKINRDRAALSRNRQKGSEAARGRRPRLTDGPTNEACSSPPRFRLRQMGQHDRARGNLRPGGFRDSRAGFRGSLARRQFREVRAFQLRLFQRQRQDVRVIDRIETGMTHVNRPRSGAKRISPSAA